MKFYTIPDAPNYEISKNFICRNRKTKRVLKLQVQDNCKFYMLWLPDQKKRIRHTPQTWLNKALAALEGRSTFEPIPSLGYRYEINEKGVVRNVRTKQILKCQANSNVILFSFGAANYSARCVADLLWEVHGIILKWRRRHCPCSAENRHGKYFFSTLKDCAQFLSSRTFINFHTLKYKLNKRVSEVEGWKITYLEEDPNNIKWNAKSLSALANRQAKLDAQQNNRPKAACVL